MKLLDKFKIGYWNVGIIEKPIEAIMNHESYHIRWVRHNYKNRFFADPFIYKQDDKYYYILAEELIFTKDKGTIVLLKVNKKTMQLVGRREVIEDEYHLSYPNYEDGYVVAENYKSGGLYRFSFENGKVKKNLILDVPLIDPTFVRYFGDTWLFGTTKEKEDDPNKKLSIFVERDGKFIPHKKNPVKTDITSARPGGHFFWHKGELYRPAQNSEHLYGEDIHIMKVKQLDEENYVEELFKVISSHESTRYNLGLHTFNVSDGFVVVDGFEYSIQICQKIKNKLSIC